MITKSFQAGRLFPSTSILPSPHALLLPDQGIYSASTLRSHVQCHFFVLCLWQVLLFRCPFGNHNDPPPSLRRRRCRLRQPLPPSSSAASLHYTSQSDGSSYTFDSVLPPSHPQGSVFSSTTVPLLRAVAAGVNATLLTYGQTGAGTCYIHRE